MVREKVVFQPVAVFQSSAEKLYHRLVKELGKKLGSGVRFEHVGSTAIPGSITKGDLDIQIRTELKDFPAVCNQLRESYTINQPENWSETFASFQDDELYEIPLGIQVTVVNTKDDINFYRLRDLLIEQPMLLDEYNAIKKRHQNSDMEQYRLEKAAFFNRLSDNLWYT